MQNVYGKTQAEVGAELARAVGMGYTPASYVTAILSDVQELLAHSLGSHESMLEAHETARQWLNKAKYILFYNIPREPRNT
jgi:hypothetical protein